MAALVFKGEVSVMPDFCTASLRSLPVSIEGDEKSSSCKIKFYTVPCEYNTHEYKHKGGTYRIFSLIHNVTHKIG